VRRLIFGFVTLDVVPLEPRFRQARERGEIEAVEYDEGMLVLALRAAAWRVPFLPTRAGLGSDVPTWNPSLRTVRSPYDDGEELLAVPALPLDLALVHVHRADARGNALILGPDPYFDDLCLMPRATARVSCEKIVDDFAASPSAPRTFIRGCSRPVVERADGAALTACDPRLRRDEDARAPTSWATRELHARRALIVACAEALRGRWRDPRQRHGAQSPARARLAQRTFAPELLVTDGGARIVDAPGGPRAGCPTARSSTSSGPAGATS
jgi:glutaconate CoA-transferase subunit A